LQWQNLIQTRGDAEAHKQAAEDSFYLGIQARTQGENEEALKYFADAANYAPQGAGPLYTREHWQTETQAAHLSLARTLADDGQIAPALDHAKAALGTSFDLAPAPPFPAFALDRAAVSMSTRERQVVFHLLAYPTMSEEARQAVAGVVDALNQTRAGSASLAAGASDFEVTLRVQFENARDMQNKLAKLHRAFPEREDWNLIRALIDVPAVEWDEETDTFTRTAHYLEEIDYASGQAPLQTKLNALSRTIGELESASPEDARAQLRLTLLKDVRLWWQRALSSPSVTFDLQAPDGTPQHWNLKLGDKTTLEYDNQAVRVEWYFIGAGGIILGLVFVLSLFFLIRSRRTRTQAAA
jgi:hypothetical protein